MPHDTTTCPLCADLFDPDTTPASYEACIKHLLFKVANLESRLQQIEWREMPLGPQPPSEKEMTDNALRLVKDLKHAHPSFFRQGKGEEGKDFARREHIVTDQGNGRAHCSNCTADVTNDYDFCPSCKLPLVEGGLHTPSGGSDF